MKKIILFTALVLGFITTNKTFASNIFGGQIDQIATAFNSKSPSLAAYLANTVELTLLDKESNYSRNQADAVLNSFFQNNQVNGFKLNHQGSSPDGSSFGIGVLSTNKGNYKVIFYLKQSGGQFLIQELRIEKD
ncbi:MAG: hypothetical protein RJA07_2316 [Bacteroidota bacterium]|jgi:hypothetical protein